MGFVRHRFTFLAKSFGSGPWFAVTKGVFPAPPELTETHSDGHSCAVFGRVPQLGSRVGHGALIGAPWVSFSLRVWEIRLERRGSCPYVPCFPPPPPCGIDALTCVGPQTHSGVDPASCRPSARFPRCPPTPYTAPPRPPCLGLHSPRDSQDRGGRLFTGSAKVLPNSALAAHCSRIQY